MIYCLLFRLELDMLKICQIILYDVMVGGDGSIFHLVIVILITIVCAFSSWKTVP